jgi:hypothetical protein
VQLDLFDSPPPPMNPNKNLITPDCFQSYEQYAEWLRLARLAKEQCTICEDCVSEYKMKMVAKQRCHEQWHSVQVVMQKKVAPLFVKPLKSNVMETQIDPLSW